MRGFSTLALLAVGTLAVQLAKESEATKLVEEKAPQDPFDYLKDAYQWIKLTRPIEIAENEEGKQEARLKKGHEKEYYDKLGWADEMANLMFYESETQRETMTPQEAAAGLAEMDKICWPELASDSPEKLEYRAK